MFGQDRNQIRQFYINSWKKANAPGQPALEPLEKLIASVIEQHPEYQPLLSDADSSLGQEFPPESGHSNPFLHMGMHIAIQEQLSCQRPAGINAIWASLCQRHNSAHEAEHQMIECLAEMLWQAQRAQQEPDQNAYLQQLNALLGNK